MKNLLIVQLLLLGVFGCFAFKSHKFSTYDQYFYNLDQKYLEENLGKLQTETLNHEYYALSIESDNYNWVQRMYNISKIATTLILGLNPALTPSAAMEIARGVNWEKMPTLTTPSYANTQWYFQLQFKRPTSGLGSVGPETELAFQWRQLTNCVLLWKTRQDNWSTFVPRKPDHQAVTPRSMAMQRLLDDLLNFLEKKFDQLLTKSFEFNLENGWLDGVFTASLISKQLISDSQAVISVQDITNSVRPLGWTLKTLAVIGRENIWNYQLVMMPEKVSSSLLLGVPTDKMDEAKGIYQEWMLLTNDVLRWKSKLLQ